MDVVVKDFERYILDFISSLDLSIVFIISWLQNSKLSPIKSTLEVYMYLRRSPFLDPNGQLATRAFPPLQLSAPVKRDGSSLITTD